MQGVSCPVSSLLDLSYLSFRTAWARSELVSGSSEPWSTQLQILLGGCEGFEPQLRRLEEKLRIVVCFKMEGGRAMKEVAKHDELQAKFELLAEPKNK